MTALEPPLGGSTPDRPTFLRVYGSHHQYVCSGWPEQYGWAYKPAFWNKLRSCFTMEEAGRYFHDAQHYETFAVVSGRRPDGTTDIILCDEDGNPTELGDGTPQVTCRKEDVVKITFIDLMGDPFP